MAGVYSRKPFAGASQMRHGCDMVEIPKLRLAGIERPVSRLILGCDNKETWEEGAPVWDHWLACGGNAFDTAWIYGGGRHEKALGEWVRRRGVAKDVVVVAKGGHPPHCTPEALGRQLAESLERLQLSSIPIYIMHRDNRDVPVGEFVDALNALRDRGLIGVFGGSNWTVERFEAARAHARARGLQPLTILNNNLSLAEMVKPIWPGCVSSHTPAAMDYLGKTGTAHFSWSSQARGYFLPVELRDRLPEDTRPETCFGNAANAERRRRAEELAARHGVSANNIALAWVLAQGFPSFALVGPRDIAELDSTLPALSCALTPDEVARLNLEKD
jgi:aryl-alcohol dehydrogenase-like predicted oxidoreductase